MKPVIIAAIVIVAIVAVLMLSGPSLLLGDVHEHADFLVVLDGTAFNFSQEKYMSGESPLSPFIHVHDMDGNVIHKHARGITLDFFFRSVGWKFNSTCIETDSNQEYCNGLRMFVNQGTIWKENFEFEDYELHDLDRILIISGPADDLNALQSSVTDKACIYSLKCPGRGTPPDESTCTTGDCAAVI